jgi:hypothetical protein
MIAKPTTVWLGTGGNNIWKGRGTAKRAVVLHIAEGPIGAVDSWFQDPQAQASSNFCVGLDGSIHEYVDPEGPDAPFANGLLNQPDVAVQRLVAAQGGANPNYWTVSIEHEGSSGDLLTAAQLAASAQLCAWACERWGIPADEDHLLGHYEFDSVTRAGCPGWNRAQWVEYEAAVSAALAPAPPPVPVPVPPAPLPCPPFDAEWEARIAMAEIAAKMTEGLLDTNLTGAASLGQAGQLSQKIVDFVNALGGTS